MQYLFFAPFGVSATAGFTWDAISAIGTAGAAITALVVWLCDRHSKIASTNADARLLATILAPQIESLGARIDDAATELWGLAGATDCPSGETRRQHFHVLADDPKALNEILNRHRRQLDTTRLETHVFKWNVLPSQAVSALSLALQSLTTVNDITTDILSMEEWEYDRKVANLDDYYFALHRAASAANAARRNLAAIAITEV